MNQPEVAPVTARARRGRVLGGVAAGLAARWQLPVSRVRGAFVLASVLLGLGLLAYLACWLILPAEGEQGRSAGMRAMVGLASACGALLGLGALGLAAALAAVFGFGWVVVALAAAVLVGTLAAWPRTGPGWALLPIGALALPSLALAAADISIDPRTEPISLAPRTLAELPPGGLRSGLGTLDVDLRQTAWPASGRFSLRIDAGVRRTLVALPHDRCVHVELHQRPVPLVLRAAREALQPLGRGGAGTGVVRSGVSAILGGRVSTSSGMATEAQLFGEPRYGTLVAQNPRRSRRRGPTLVIHFASDGGRLVVRDYPDDVDPWLQPDWPGQVVVEEERPDVAGLQRAEARRILRSWRKRRADQLRDGRRVARNFAGPCARRETRR
jgi:phage shock protein PspC (stress-responsive transcriptional regulator)